MVKRKGDSGCVLSFWESVTALAAGNEKGLARIAPQQRKNQAPYITLLFHMAAVRCIEPRDSTISFIPRTV